MEQLEKMRHANPPIIFKLRVYDGVIRTKLLYGLESAQLTKQTQAKIDVFQLKGLRRRLKMPTTYVNRLNSNKKAYETTENKAYSEDEKTF